MRIRCAPANHPAFKDVPPDMLRVLLYGRTSDSQAASVGAAVLETIQRQKLVPTERAWDLLTIALSVITADQACQRGTSPDGWTRQLDLQIAVTDSAFWTKQHDLIEHQLRFLTTDIWTLEFIDGGQGPPPVPSSPHAPDACCAALLSGGLDSFVGALDLVKDGRRPVLVSQVAAGDKHTQAELARAIGPDLAHLQLNHNALTPGIAERSQRSRSLVFLAYGVLASTSLQCYARGERVTLYMPENGFISVNPPLTPDRIGSLSTRTTHPAFLKMFQSLLSAAKISVQVINPLQLKTKGQSLTECNNQDVLLQNAHATTSCGRFARNAFTHCGRCIPCLVRRAAFHAWGHADQTDYVYRKLAKRDRDHALFDDVRSVATALATVDVDGFDAWLGQCLNSAVLGETRAYREVAHRGIAELGAFFEAMRIK